jgi:hypothetical protein
MGLIVASVAACGGSNSTNPGGGEQPLSQQVINLYPASSTSGNRLYVMVSSVGSCFSTVDLPCLSISTRALGGWK